MWAQFISGTLKRDKEEDLPKLIDRLRSIQQPGSGFVRSTALRDQNDTSRVHFLIVFENQEQAHALENDPRHQDGVQAMRDTMAEIFDGRPDYAGLTIVDEWTG
jgi:hypothetical protein